MLYYGKQVRRGKSSLRGRRLKGKGKRVLGARETQGARFPRAPNLFSLPFQTPATHAMESPG